MADGNNTATGSFDEELKRLAIRLDAEQHYERTRAMTLRERLHAAWMACVEWRYAFEGALRGWR